MSLANISLLVAVALFGNAWADNGSYTDEAALPFNGFDVLTVEQGPCLFNCPTFTVSIHSDGLVRHFGPSFDHTGGPAESRAERQGLEQIAKALRVARIDEMRDTYNSKADGCEHLFSDMATVVLTASQRQGLQTKRVVLNTGCVGAAVPTKRIAELINAISQITGTRVLLERRKLVQTSDEASNSR